MLKIKETPNNCRPREKLISKGPEALSDSELIATILGSGIKGKNVLLLARSILKKFDKINEVPDIKELLSIDGIGLAKACQIIASIEFSRRRFFRESIIIKKSQDVIPLISHIAGKKQENFLCISLNGANEVISNRIITIGLLNSSQIHPREIFADAITDRAASVILAHNHPSGQLKPSPEDIHMTSQIVESGEILGIPVLDHIIISQKGFYSFKKHDLI